jgi:glycosyltransferase EpsD
VNKKVLFCATVDYHFKAFHLPYLQWFKEQGWEVHVAASGKIKLPHVDKKYDIPIQRSPIHKLNIAAYSELKKIIEKNNYKIIHCHTPMGGVLTRLAARSVRKHGTKVIYTAHGFHFCKGAPVLNWLVYYPIEKVLSRYTDYLITINQEDYQLATKHRFKAGIISHVHGVGVDTNRFKPATSQQKVQLRKEFGYKNDEFLMFYAAEFNKNKNQQLLIRILELMKGEVPKAKLLLAGEGPLLKECQNLAAQLGIDKMIDFLGYRTDIETLLKISDVAVASSFREGLPVNIMEAMACGLPIIATDNRGHRELVKDQINGWVIKQQKVVEYSDRLITLAHDQNRRLEFGMNSLNRIMTTYSVNQVLEEKIILYLDNMGEKEDALWTAH